MTPCHSSLDGRHRGLRHAVVGGYVDLPSRVCVDATNLVVGQSRRVHLGASVDEAALLGVSHVVSVVSEVQVSGSNASLDVAVMKYGQPVGDGADERAVGDPVYSVDHAVYGHDPVALLVGLGGPQPARLGDVHVPHESVQVTVSHHTNSVPGHNYVFDTSSVVYATLVAAGYEFTTEVT